MSSKSKCCGWSTRFLPYMQETVKVFDGVKKRDINVSIGVRRCAKCDKSLGISIANGCSVCKESLPDDQFRDEEGVKNWVKDHLTSHFWEDGKLDDALMSQWEYNKDCDDGDEYD